MHQLGPIIKDNCTVLWDHASHVHNGGIVWCVYVLEVM